MDSNILSTYTGRDLSPIIRGLEIVEGTSKQTGNPYYAVEMTFNNGYKKRLFLRNEELFAWVNAFELYDHSIEISKDQ